MILRRGARRSLFAGALMMTASGLAPAWSGESDVAARDSFTEAVRLEHGEGVKQDYARALGLYCEAARHGDVRAFLNLGWMFANGRGVPRDAGVAVGWWRKAAAQGDEQGINLVHLLAATPTANDLGCGDLATEPPPWPIEPAPALRATIERVAQSQGVDAKLVMAVIAAESAFNERAISPKKAQGLMQLMPETVTRFGVRDPFDAEENIRGGATYLRSLLARYQGDVTLVLAAYNAGEEKVDLYNGVPPFNETRHYVERVKRFYAAAR